MKSIRTLLHDTIDYAGLFPPARLELAPAIENYAAYRQGSRAWALGRFIVPVGRLAELEEAAAGLLPRGKSAAPWRISALAGADLQKDFDSISAFNRRHEPGAGLGAAVIDTVELKTSDAAAVRQALRVLPATLTAYCEIPLDADLTTCIAALAEAGGRAKVRTGGVVADMIPAPAELLRFLAACISAQVPFKATAGLHHPLRSVQPLTYEADSATTTMHGFLNVFLAAALLQREQPLAAAEILEETSAAALRCDEGGITWREHWLSNEALAQLRQIAISFGSCSFQEPMDDLEALGLL